LGRKYQRMLSHRAHYRGKQETPPWICVEMRTHDWISIRSWDSLASKDLAWTTKQRMNCALVNRVRSWPGSRWPEYIIMVPIHDFGEWPSTWIMPNHTAFHFPFRVPKNEPSYIRKCDTLDHLFRDLLQIHAS
jgi:hypothetical protein